jgi:hypothetical protein
MFDKLFGWGKKKEEEPSPEPGIYFGRYSDNNKTVEKTNRWTQADQLFKEKNFRESINHIFDYLRDDAVGNVTIEQEGSGQRFQIYQGSKIIRGTINNESIQAEVSLARMPTPNVPVMRRLLEMNFLLYYSRFALDGDRLCMRFDSAIENASPSKLFYGLRELATKADKQDELIVSDFAALQSTDTEHVEEIPRSEKEVKFRYFQQWIQQTLALIAPLDPDKFSGGISFLLLGLIYRLDYMILPEGKLLNELESITSIYFIKDDKSAQQKNRDMAEALQKLLSKTAEEVFPSLYRYKSTFAIVAPQHYKTIADNIYNANQNIAWYRDNGHPEIARQISEYGISFCQYSYSLPRPLTELFHLMTQVNYPDYFSDLGFTNLYSNKTANSFETKKITERINAIIAKWQPKYPKLAFKTDTLKFDTIINFNHTFTSELEFLNFDI